MKKYNLTYLSRITESKINGNNTNYLLYRFNLPKQILIDYKIDEPLNYYRLGNFKTKEIFKKGKLYISKRINKNTNETLISFSKGIPKSLVDKLQIEKYDVLKIMLEDDIIWIEKIDDFSNLEYRFILTIYYSEMYGITISIPSFFVKNIFQLNRGHLINSFVSLIYNDKKTDSLTISELRTESNDAIFRIYIKKEIQKKIKLIPGKYIANFKKKTLTIEKLLDLDKEDE